METFVEAQWVKGFRRRRYAIKVFEKASPAPMLSDTIRVTGAAAPVPLPLHVGLSRLYGALNRIQTQPWASRYDVSEISCSLHKGGVRNLQRGWSFRKGG